MEAGTPFVDSLSIRRRGRGRGRIDLVRFGLERAAARAAQTPRDRPSTVATPSRSKRQPRSIGWLMH